MDVFWTGFIGVLVGALVSFVTLLMTNHQQNTIANREAAERANGRQREAVATLLGVVSKDIAQFRGEISPVQGNGSNLELAEFFDAIRPRIGSAADLARAFAATVSAASVRDAAQNVYAAWSAYATGQYDAIINETKQSISNLAEEASTQAPSEFYKAVQDYLEQLDTGQ